MPRELARLLNPQSIALFGGVWAENVVTQLQKSGYDGDIWPVHPKRQDILGVPCFSSLDDLPGPPDASFIGVNREATVEIVKALSAMGAGGATCFASGFGESEGEGTNGASLQHALVNAAGAMPVLGPNCYGFLNYLDNVTFWPDQHGGQSCDRGVAIIAQSSNIAINMTMQRRGLPIGFLATIGNGAQIGAWAIANQLLEDDRITAIGLFLEGLGDLRAMEELASEARAKGKPLVVFKTGRTEAYRTAAITHTASMSGPAEFSSALFERLGFIETTDLEAFLETLKLAHYLDPLKGKAVCSVSSSGGEAGLMSDMAAGTSIDFRAFTASAKGSLKKALGPIVTVANPLDYHTFIWSDVPTMTEVFSAAMADGFDLCLFVLDLPRPDTCDQSGYRCAVEAIVSAKKQTGGNVAVIATLPENLTEETAAEFSHAGIATLNGLKAGLAAVNGLIKIGPLGELANTRQALALVNSAGRVARKPKTLSEPESKRELAKHGVKIPPNVWANTTDEAIHAARAHLKPPYAMKVCGLAHKSEAGGVLLNLNSIEALEMASTDLPEGDGYLIEEMVGDVLAELIVGVTLQTDGAYLMTIGAGGVLTEILDDKAYLLLPATSDDIINALQRLRIHPLLTGYRGKPPTDMTKLVKAILAIGEAALSAGKCELDVNPLMVREKDAVAADALLVLYE